MRREPFDMWDDMIAMQMAMNKFTDGFFGEATPTMRTREGLWRPLVDVCETSEEVIVTVELPGVRREDVQLIYHDGHLVVSGQRERRESGQRERHPCERQRWCQQMEIPYGPFERVIPIQSPVEPDQCKAVYRDGFLEVVFRKAPQPVVRVVRVEVR
jgi:HSP20 family protein